jgi:hypothetical protein
LTGGPHCTLKEVAVTSARKILHFGLPVAGTALAVAAAVAVRDPVVRLVLVVAGVLLIQSVTARLPYYIVRNERRFRQLRSELDEFLWLVRELNAAAVDARTNPNAEDRFDDLHLALQESLERMTLYAGRTDDDLLEEQPDLQPS